MTLEPTPTSRRGFLALAPAVCLAAGMDSPAHAAQQPAPSPLEEEIRRLADDAPLRLRFRGTTAEECRKWQTAFAEALRSSLGAYQPPAKWQMTVERVVERDDHRREELLLTAPGQRPLPVYLLTPKDKRRGQRAGIVALHGHGRFGYDAIVARELTPGIEKAVKSANYDYGLQLVRRGYVVAAPCLTPFGRRLGDPAAYRNQDPCAITFLRMQLLGKVLIAENLRDVLWAVELLARHKQVDARRLGCVGLSYGGRMTMLATALEPRLRAAVVSGALNCMQERVAVRYSCGAQIIPGLLQYGDVPETGGLIAPRPCLWQAGTRDALMVPRWIDLAMRRIGQAYIALGAKEQLQLDRFDGGHVWHGERAYPFLEKALRG
ncbi:MAG TPA: prolyl oligopeptidase family serine peptidase [Gemmataceae bacterium]|nr:prolyl oligopeptidase family serine peptidase [Gemmataceae bacterium]